MSVTKITDIIRPADTHADRPLATAVPAGTLYPCTDHGKTYQSDGTSWNDWDPFAATLSHNLDDLADVDLSTPPTDGQALVYDDTTDTWVPGTVSGGGGGAVATDTIWDAKGDIALGTGSNTASKVSIGTNGSLLIADSAQTQGAKWMKALAVTVNTPPTQPQAQNDEFNDDTGNSGPVNGLDAKWTKRNMGTPSWAVLDAEKAVDAFLFDIPSGQATSQGIYQAAPSGDFTIQCRNTWMGISDREMWGLAILDTSGNGVGVLHDDPGSDTVYLRSISAWAAGSTLATVVAPGTSNLNTQWKATTPCYLSLRKSGGTYYAAGWFQEAVQAKLAGEVSATPSAFTPAYIMFGRFYASSGGSAKVLLDWFRRTA